MKNTSRPQNLLLRRRTLFALGAVALLPACGGGGGNAGTDTPNAPVIASGPVNLAVSTGASATFSVSASGAAPLSWQWLKDGKEVPGANAASYTLPRAALADSNSKWQVVVKNGFGSVTSSAAQLKVSGIELFAGALAESGSVDGVASSARFNHPQGLAVDAAGNVYVADSSNFTIRKIGVNGQVSTLVGKAGTYDQVDGSGDAARFLSLRTMMLDKDGNLLALDAQDVRKITPQGVVSTIASVPMGTSDGRSAIVFVPAGLAQDGSGNLYITNGLGTRRITANGELKILEGQNSADGLFGTRIFMPRGLALDAKGNVLLFNMENAIVKIDANGGFSRVAGGQLGTQDGAGAAAQFNGRNYFAADKLGNLFIAESGDNRIRKMTADGVVSTVAGQLQQGEIALGALPGKTGSPNGIAVDANGMLYITVGHAVLKIGL